MTTLSKLDTEYDAGPASRFSIDLPRIWAAVYRSRFIIGAIMVACLLAGLAITILTTPIYRASATIQIDQEAAKVLGTEQTDLSASIQDAERFLETQIGIIQSRSVAMAVARDLRLLNGDGFLVAMDVDVDSIEESPLPPAKAREELVLKTLSENMSVNLPRVSRLATISFDSPQAELAARVANAYAENFIRSNLDRKFESSAYAREFIAKQLQEAQGRLEQSERAAISFARETGIIDASKGVASGGDDAPSSLTTSTLVQLNDAYSAALARQSSADRRWQAVRSRSVMSLPEVTSNAAIQQLVVQQAEAEARLQELMQRRTAAHPEVLQLQERLKELKSQQQSLANSIREGIRTERDIAVQQASEIGSQVNAFKGSTLTEQAQGVQLSILRREADTNRRQYESLLQRFNQINAEAGVQTNNVTIVDRASVPSEPTWPRLLLNMFLALFLGVAISAATVFGREQVFARINSPDDIGDRLGLPVLGAIPLWSERQDLIEQMSDPKSPVSEAYNSVRSSMSLIAGKELPRSIAFVSTQAREGKSSTCVATAISLSKLGKKCVVVDLDLRRPNVHKLLEIRNAAGASNLLAGTASASDAVQQTEFPNLSVITSGPIPPNPTELLSDDRISALLSELAQSYDTILVDSAPILGLADALAVTHNTEGTVFVIEAGRNSPSSVLRAISRLREDGEKVLGVVLSRFDARKMGYGEDAGYSYVYD